MNLASSEDARGAFADERQLEIARFVEEHGRARVAELADHFGVSAVTIRKDLDSLAGTGRVIRTHGGAIAARVRRQDLTHDVRDQMQREEKAAIGALAAAQVSPGESILIDASTTGLYVARELMHRGAGQSLTIVTNSIRMASELAVRPDIIVLLMGGRVRGRSMSLVGQLGDAVLDRVNVQKAFVGAAGFTELADHAFVIDTEFDVLFLEPHHHRRAVRLEDSHSRHVVEHRLVCRQHLQLRLHALHRRHRCDVSGGSRRLGQELNVPQGRCHDDDTDHAGQEPVG